LHCFICLGKGKMARRYDSSTTTFSPDGRLHQVEYAIEAINNAGTAVGILAADGIVLAGEKHKPSSLLAPSKASEKMYKIDEHVVTVVAGLTADANILIQQSRVSAQRYIFTYQEPMPVGPNLPEAVELRYFKPNRGCAPHLFTS